jgi:hypothetical protein
MSKRRDAIWQRLKRWEKSPPKRGGFLYKEMPQPHDERQIAKACEVLGLDPTDKRDRDVCLAVLADVLYRIPVNANALEESKPAGKPPSWIEGSEMHQGLMADLQKASKGIVKNGQLDWGDVPKIRERLKDPKKHGPFKLNYKEFEDLVIDTWIRNDPALRRSKKV